MVIMAEAKWMMGARLGDMLRIKLDGSWKFISIAGNIMTSLAGPV